MRSVTPSAAALALWLVLAAAARGALHEAHIQITVSGDTASVIAWYRFMGIGDSLRFRATHPARQTLVFQGVSGVAGFRLDTLPDGFRLASEGTDAAPALDVRYHVIGRLDSIPLFVPELPTAPGRGDVLVRVSGEARPQPLAGSRFRPEPGDGWLARVTRVPPCIVLAPRAARR
jgi:hypothetical protein